MSALTPWDPFRELDELQNRLATMFGRIPQRQGARTGNEAMTTADWAPMVDISEDENAFLLKLVTEPWSACLTRSACVLLCAVQSIVVSTTYLASTAR